ncbi:MAG: 16S rRNA (uracil(1498)-N(3))-methyltransferase [Clostridiales bacterium]|nr:16S rRNA (uracil(1498)-N(3))-methyltransferase [Clostridiales bacterium]
MTRFFISKSAVGGDEIRFEEPAHMRALRLRKGDELILCDGDGTDYHCRLTKVDDKSAVAEIIRRAPSQGEPDVEVSVYMAYSKGDKLDCAVQKCVELGAASIYLFPSAHVVALPDAKSLPKKLERMNAISKSAAEQSGRGIIPPVSALESFDRAITRAVDTHLPLFCYEGERHVSLRDALKAVPAPVGVTIVTGCEGGFTQGEANLALQRGMISVSLGSRILRCDTAPIAALAAVMFSTGNL